MGVKEDFLHFLSSLGSPPDYLLSFPMKTVPSPGSSHHPSSPARTRRASRTHLDTHPVSSRAHLSIPRIARHSAPISKSTPCSARCPPMLTSTPIHRESSRRHPSHADLDSDPVSSPRPSSTHLCSHLRARRLSSTSFAIPCSPRR
ncbi:hypothetical protein JAAARDRAFT_40599 [Jaapia argillacea MUCL 33604]|uniref:Uncharacterized protein n=1 Tax=Jaapia argillacea MUCL 33604 TaxID=933084 RepID=A0A067PLV9_9AGAM|nr:hypothetical protein JAAARDRAFT_40599 [Jaapia argillacea MUCL 33604]